MDYTYRERHGEAIYRFKGLPSRRRGPALAKAGDGMLPRDFFRRNVVLSFQEDAIGIRLRDVIGPDNMMWDNMVWGSDYPHGESGRRSRVEVLEGVPEQQTSQACPGPRSGDRRRRHHPRVPFLTWRGLPSLLEEPNSLRIDELGVPALLIGRSAHCRRPSPAARGSCGQAITRAIAIVGIEAVYGFTCCSRGLTSSKSITPFRSSMITSWLRSIQRLTSATSAAGKLPAQFHVAAVARLSTERRQDATAVKSAKFLTRKCALRG